MIRRAVARPFAGEDARERLARLMSEAQRNRVPESEMTLSFADVFGDGTAAPKRDEPSVTLDWRERCLTLQDSVLFELDHTGTVQWVRAPEWEVEKVLSPLAEVPFFRQAAALHAAQKRFSDVWLAFAKLSHKRARRRAGPSDPLTKEEKAAVETVLVTAESILQLRGTRYERKGSKLILRPNDNSVFARFTAPLQRAHIDVGIDPVAMLLGGANATFTGRRKNFVHRRSPWISPSFLSLSLEAILTGDYEWGAHHEIGHAQLYVRRMKRRASPFAGQLHYLNDSSEPIPGASEAGPYHEFASLDEPRQFARELGGVLSMYRRSRTCSQTVCLQAEKPLADLVNLSARQAAALARAAGAPSPSRRYAGVDWYREAPGVQMLLPILPGLEDGRHLDEMIAWRADLYSAMAKLGGQIQATLSRVLAEEEDLEALRRDVLALNRFIARSERTYEDAVKRSATGEAWRPRTVAKLLRKYGIPPDGVSSAT
jgi:hypothetical protein